MASGAPARAPEQDWSRAGAHNIAGVSFQVAVTAKLLVGALAGGFPLAHATPEGFEDIDVELRDGTRGLVQVKERAPSARFGRANLADALRKKKTLLEGDPARRFVLVTDATLGGGLVPTGWDRPVTECIGRTSVDELATHLEVDFDDPMGILARTHIVQVERSIIEGTRSELAGLRVIANQPSVAVLIYARLVEQITEIAARQRATTPDTAQSITPADVETLATRVIETVDVQSLDEAVRTGLVEPVDFGVRPDLSIEEFLAGVDVLPAHIAADLDLPRDAEVQALTHALSEKHSALLKGPSGSGKSTLMWRTARELSGTRLYRVLRLLPEDVPTLNRWLRLQELSENFPLLLCVDNLGRPATAGWSEFAREIIDRPGVLLLGACREEDYRPGLAVGRTMIVEPTLDRRLAEGIGAALADRDIQTVVDIAEAFEASEDLLMEFLSMLLTGRRLRQVVEEQVAARLSEGRRTEREVLRYVATAHSAGVAIPAEVLESLLPGRDLAPALDVLKREHLVVADDGNRWQGLHELRSEVARDYLHQFPPPASATTVRRLVEHLSVDDACRIIEVYARLDAELVPAAEAASGMLRSSDIRTGDATRLVASLAMADAFRHARACLEIIQDRRPRNLDPWTALFFAYSRRFGGISLDALIATRPGLAQLNEIAVALPPRPPSLRDACLQGLSAKAVRDIALRGTADEAAAWLESLEDSSAEPTVSAESVWTHFSGAPLDAGARLSATLRRLAASENIERLDEVFGTLDVRVQQLAAEFPDCIGAETKDEPDGRVVSLLLLAPEDDSALHDRSMQTCQAILDLCPEADIAEVIVVTPGGDPYSVGGVEDGHKRMARANLPRVPQTSGNANFLRAARLLLASRYWTQPLRALAGASRQLLAFREDAVAWLLNPHHNAGRRRRAIALIDSLVAELASQPGEPVGQDGGAVDSKARDAVRDALTAIRDIAAAESVAHQQLVALGSRCRGAVKHLTTARLADLPTLSTAGEPLPEALDEMLTLLADVLLVHAEGREVPFKPLRRSGAESWVDVADRLVREAASRGYEAERATLEEALGTPAALELRRVGHVDVGSVRFLTDRWVVIIAAESVDPYPLAFAERLAPELVKQLAFRTFMVCGTGGRILPLNARKMGTSQLWPAEEEELLAIASGLGTGVLESPHLQAWDTFVVELVRASRAAALLRLRGNAGLARDDAPFRSRYESARRTLEACHPALHGEAARLLERVEREPSGGEQTLAEECYRSVTHAEQSDEVAALAALRVVAQSSDLSGG